MFSHLRASWLTLILHLIYISYSWKEFLKLSFNSTNSLWHCISTSNFNHYQSLSPCFRFKTQCVSSRPSLEEGYVISKVPVGAEAASEAPLAHHETQRQHEEGADARHDVGDGHERRLVRLGDVVAAVLQVDAVERTLHRRRAKLIVHWSREKLDISTVVGFHSSMHNMSALTVFE